MTTATLTDKTAAKFRKMADGLQTSIDRLRAPRLDNTPKRQRECMSARIEADLLARIQSALLALADAREAGTLPAILETIKSKTELRTMLATRLNSTGYYNIYDTGEYHDQSAAAVALRNLIESAKSAGSREQEEERKRRQQIERMEQEIRFVEIPGFFPTPRAVIDEMLDRACLDDGQAILEPSAGKGDIADAIRDRRGEFVELVCCELNYRLCDILSAKGHQTVAGCFIERFSVSDPQNDGALGLHGEVSPEMAKWDRILMNPPFERGQDIDHVRHAYKLLKPGGRLVSLMGAGAFSSGNRKCEEFRQWFAEVGGEVEELPEGSFKGAGAFRETGVAVRMVVIEKGGA